MSWTTAITDLRFLLSDNETDKLGYRKAILGERNSVNLRFKTFEDRRVTNFKTETNLSLGVHVAGVRIANAGITSDDPSIGEVILVAAPANTQRVEASYYYQWYLDTELEMFLRQATQWLGLGSDKDLIPAGLQPAALYFSAQEALHKITLKWSQRMSEVYKMEDSPDENRVAAIEEYRKIALDYKQKSEDLRATFYTRQDQGLAPLYGFALGTVRPVVPKR